MEQLDLFDEFIENICICKPRYEFATKTFQRAWNNKCPVHGKKRGNNDAEKSNKKKRRSQDHIIKR